MKEMQQEDKMKNKEIVTLQDQIYFLHQQIEAIKNDLILIKYNTYLSWKICGTNTDKNSS